MQTSLLDQYPSAHFTVYAVWLPMLWGDAREEWNDTTMPDPRVIHFWDSERVAGAWFAREIEGYDGTAWDVYYLFGPDAEWENVPASLVGSGGTIIREHEKLEMEVRTLMEK